MTKKMYEDKVIVLKVFGFPRERKNETLNARQFLKTVLILIKKSDFVCNN